MIKQRLTRLERALHSSDKVRCTRCGGRDGVGGVPLVMVEGVYRGDERTTYGADRRCSHCGAVPPHALDVVVDADECEDDDEEP